MKRREFLTTAAAVAAPSAAPLTAAPLSTAPLRTSMGVASNSYLTIKRIRDPHAFLEMCHGLGAGGIQAPLPTPGTAAKLRARCEQLGMYYEGMAALAGDDTAAYEAQLRTAREAGALCLRSTCLSGRRYETFATMDAWKRFVADSRAKLARTIPLAEKHKVPIAIENHKDWTQEELLKLLKEFESPYFGLCLDTGNNVSLLDDADAFIEALAPYALSTHIKDMGVEPYADGFLLSEVTFGAGYVNLKRAIELVRRHRPATKFTLEMITRDPLKIPCLTEKYWVTMPGRDAALLAAALRRARQHKPLQGLPWLSRLPQAAQARDEENNVKTCLAFAREQLGLIA
ncbi:MAG: sugar phosphate isomerase/epimerase [Bryobacterales bacterium]|nr:sugar phosphate isomerase/epimerase [Bryobacterales bacterium]